MNTFNQMQECLICSGRSKIMISLQQSMREYGGLSMAQALEDMHFLVIPDFINCYQNLCFICATKVQACYDFKAKCGQTQSALQAYAESNEEEVEISLQLSPSPDSSIKSEIKIDEDLFHIEKNDTNLIVNEIAIPSENSSDEKFTVEILSNTNITTQEPSASNCSIELERVNSIPPLEIKVETTKKIKENQTTNPPAPERPYVCTVCFKAFRQKIHLHEHFRVHTGVKPFVCDVCNKSFTQSSNLNAHKLIHTGERPYVCDVCSKAFNHVRNLKTHKLRHVQDKKYICKICSRIFIHESDLDNHRVIHTGEKSYVCDVCQKSFAHTNSLVAHKRVHSNVRSPYVCDICNKTFRQLNTYNFHKLKHTHNRPYSCDICNKSYKIARCFLAHKLCHQV